MTFHGSEMPEVGSRAELGNDISLVELEDEPDSGIYRWHQEKIHLLPVSTMLWLAMYFYGELD